MIQALGKMYSLRTQRGGLRLHRSLLLTLVMKSARDIYHSARLQSENKGHCDSSSVTGNTSQTEEPMDTSSSVSEVPAMETQSTQDAQRSGHEHDPHVHRPAEPTVDKENCNPNRPDRHSRKRRSKTATEPDFLPCKKAKLNSGEVKGILQNNSANCGIKLDSLSLVHMPRAIVTF